MSDIVTQHSLNAEIAFSIDLAKKQNRSRQKRVVWFEFIFEAGDAVGSIFIVGGLTQQTVKADFPLERVGIQDNAAFNVAHVAGAREITVAAPPRRVHVTVGVSELAPIMGFRYARGSAGGVNDMVSRIRMA